MCFTDSNMKLRNRSVYNFSCTLVIPPLHIYHACGIPTDKGIVDHRYCYRKNRIVPLAANQIFFQTAVVLMPFLLTIYTNEDQTVALLLIVCSFMLRWGYSTLIVNSKPIAHYSPHVTPLYFKTFGCRMGDDGWVRKRRYVIVML